MDPSNDGIQDQAGTDAGTFAEAYQFLGTSTIIQRDQGMTGGTSAATLSYIAQSGDTSILPSNTITSAGTPIQRDVALEERF